MKNKIYTVFDAIHAEEDLKRKTAAFLKSEIEKNLSKEERKKKKHSIFCKRVATILAFAILILIGVSTKLYYTQKTFIDVDINPSIELTVNPFQIVIHATAYNEDGINILKELNLENKSYKRAIELLLYAMKQKGYLKEDDLVSVTLQSDDKKLEENLLNTLKVMVNDLINEQNIHVKTDIFIISEETKYVSHEHHVSPAKYLAILEAIEIDPSVTIEGCKGHSIRELQQIVNEYEQYNIDLENEYNIDLENEYNSDLENECNSDLESGCKSEMDLDNDYNTEMEEESEHSIHGHHGNRHK